MSNGQDSLNSASTGKESPTQHKPYVPATTSPPEFTVKSMVAGMAFGICFGAANAYLGLQAGLMA